MVHDVVILASASPWTWALANALRRHFGDVAIILEDTEPTSVFLRRRIRRLGLVTVMGQVAFGLSARALPATPSTAGTDHPEAGRAGRDVARLRCRACPLCQRSTDDRAPEHAAPQDRGRVANARLVAIASFRHSGDVHQRTYRDHAPVSRSSRRLLGFGRWRSCQLRGDGPHRGSGSRYRSDHWTSAHHAVIFRQLFHISLGPARSRVADPDTGDRGWAGRAAGGHTVGDGRPH
jgi:hypothetical protein